MNSMLDIPKIYQDRLKEVHHYFSKEQFKSYEVYLFGSYVTNQIKDTSDIDILLLLDEEVEPKRAKVLRMDIRYDYEEKIKYAYEVDVKVYGKSRFYELASKLSFESEVAKYMLPLKEAVACE